MCTICIIKLLVLTLMFTVPCCVGDSTPVEAYIHMDGIKGLVSMTKQATPGGNVMIYMDMAGLTVSDSFSWTINQFPVKRDSQHPCSRENLGSVFVNQSSTLKLTANNQATYHDIHSSIQLMGSNSVLGRSFVLTSSDKVVCGTIVPSGDVIMSVMTLNGDGLNGHVYFRQSAASDAEPTTVHVDATISDENLQEENVKFQIQKADMTPDAECALRSPYNPRDVLEPANCLTSHSSCAVGNLHKKHGDFVMPSSATRWQAVVTDTNLPLQGDNSIIGTMLVLKLNAHWFVCGKIRKLEKKTVQAKFNMKGVTGCITFEQETPFDSTSVKVDLSNLSKRAGKYHVHQWPLPLRVTESDSVCSGSSVGGHHNPLSITNAPANGTNDQYEIGDLSGKFGTLTDADSFSRTFKDWNLPLFGSNSIIGRSVVIHAPSGARFVCTSIGYPGPVTIATTQFYYPMIGQLVLTQSSSDPDSDISVMVRLHSVPKLVTHLNWALYVSSTLDDFVKDEGRCAQIGSKYRAAGNLKAMTVKSGSVTELHTTSSLPLSGANSVVGRSIVIQSQGGVDEAYACGTIRLSHPVRAKVSHWSVNHDVLNGEISFRPVPDNPSYTEVAVDLKNLNKEASLYHIHVYPVHVTEGMMACSYVGGHFNPFNIAYSTDSVSATFDQFEVGDFSGKYGSLAGKEVYNKRHQDNNLPLRGTNGIIGRSVIIHRSDKRICGTIKHDFDSNVAEIRKSIARFVEDGLDGYIEFTQLVYFDGSSSDTQVEISIFRIDNQITKNHKWHVHENDIDEMLTFSKCQSGGGHFNPYRIETSNKTAYSQRCSVSSPFFCELGDLSSRHGAYSIGEGRRFYQDANLPLHGPFTINGRSIVIHEKDLGSPRYVCTNILPKQAEVTLLYRYPITVVYSRVDLEKEISNALGATPGDISVHWVSDMDVKHCTTVHIDFLGKHANEMKYKLADVMSNLNKYAPGDCKGAIIFSKWAQSENKASPGSVCKLPVIAVLVLVSLLSFKC